MFRVNRKRILRSKVDENHPLIYRQFRKTDNIQRPRRFSPDHSHNRARKKRVFNLFLTCLAERTMGEVIISMRQKPTNLCTYWESIPGYTPQEVLSEETSPGSASELSQCHTIHDQLFQPGRYLVVKKTFKRAIGQPNIKRKNRTTHTTLFAFRQKDFP